jgi:hypothetical protein
MAQRLLAVVMRSPKELRLVADVLDKQERQDPRQANIIGAYLACVTLTKRYPTLVPSHARAARDHFISRSLLRCEKLLA